MVNEQNKRKPRYWYEYAGEKYMVPEHFVYRIHPTKGGGTDISESFFTWAFNKHNISIVDIDIIYASEDRTPKPANKDSTAASSTFFVAKVKGRDKRGIEKVGDGESGNESITNFQRGFPAGLAIKRAKVNMGKEFFNLVDLKLAIDCRDVVVEFGEYKGQTLEQIAQTPQGVNTIRWFASDKFNGDDILKMKAQEFISLYLQQGQSSGNSSNNTHSTQLEVKERNINPPQTNNTYSNNSPSIQSQPMTQKQKEIMGQYRRAKFLTDQQINNIAKELFGPQFSWKHATYEQGEKFIQRLETLYGKI